MRDAAGELAERFEALRLLQGFFRAWRLRASS
jgi:hypothetical protein